jgi:hypothetical protein
VKRTGDKSGRGNRRNIRMELISGVTRLWAGFAGSQEDPMGDFSEHDDLCLGFIRSR